MIRPAREAIGGTEQADRKNRREPDRLDTNRRVRGGELRELERAIGVDVERELLLQRRVLELEIY